MLVKIP